jgi:hypothetical protein
MSDNAVYRSREHLFDKEVAALTKADGRIGRHGERTATVKML